MKDQLASLMSDLVQRQLEISTSIEELLALTERSGPTELSNEVRRHLQLANTGATLMAEKLGAKSST